MQEQTKENIFLRLWNFIKTIPWWGWVSGAGLFILQYAMYRGGDLLSRAIGTINYAWVPKIDVIDDAIPLIPIFAFIYVFSYGIWVVHPMIISTGDRGNFYNFIIGMLVSYVIGTLFLIISPTYMDRAAEGLMDAASKPGFLAGFLATIYGADGEEMAFNLFPSFHCMITAYCYFGVMGRKEFPKWFRVYSLVILILICLSTVLTKQHYVIDIFGGVGIAAIVYFPIRWINPGEKILRRKQEKTATQE